MAATVNEANQHFNNVADKPTSAIHVFRRYAPLIIIIIGILIRLPLSFLPLTYSATDTWRQADTASIAHNFITSGNILYPQINWGGNGPGYVEAEFQLMPYTVSILYRIFGEHDWFGRVLSLVLTAGTFGIFYLLARRLVGRNVALWSLLFLAISPLSIRYSVTFMPEATVFFFYVLSLYLFDKWLETEKRSTLLFAAVTTALAILVKPTSIHIGLIFLMLVLVRYRLNVIKHWELWVFGVICLVPGILWFLHARDLYLQYGNTFGVISGGDSKLGNFSYWLSPSFYLNLIRLDVRWILTIGGIIPFLIGLGLAVRRRQPALLICGAIVIPVYYMIVARYAQEEWGIQYHIFALPYICLGVGIGLDWLFKRFKAGLPVLTAVKSPLVLVGAATLVLVLVSTVQIYRNELLVPVGQNLADCAKSVDSVVPADARIIVATDSLAIDHGTPNNYEEPNIFYDSERYGWSLPADWYTPEKVQEYRSQGAQYLVIPFNQLAPSLTDYVQSNTSQVGPGVASGCGIYQFNKTS